MPIREDGAQGAEAKKDLLLSRLLAYYSYASLRPSVMGGYKRFESKAS